MKHFKLFFILTMVLTTIGFPAQATKVVDIIAGSENHTILETAIAESNLEDDLRGAGPFTIFAPTDAAFEALPKGTVDALLADSRRSLTDILLNHVLSGKVKSSDLSDGMTATTYYGEDLEIAVNDEGIFINGVKVTVADLEADNGVVHVIDVLLLPEEYQSLAELPETVVDIATSNNDFSILVAALTREDLTIDFVGALTGEGPFTVFAPTNAAFAALLAELGATSLDDIDTATLEAVLQMHVLAGKVMSTDLSEGLTAETLLGQELRFSLEGGATVTDPNGRVSNITAVDIEAQNGVVHVIDAVILSKILPATVVDIATSNDDFSILVAALTREDLTIDFVGALTGEGPFTVFAPTNAAFAALLAELGASSLDDIDTATLEAVLQMHVLAGKVMSTDLSEGLTTETLLGQELTFSLEDGATVTDPNGRVSNITAVDIEAQNGVVHVIDRVILVDLRPATVVDIVVGSADHNTLTTALVAAGLVDALSAEGPFTVFAPTDAAFAALPEGVIDALLEDPSGALTEILLYHVLAGKVKSSDLSDGMRATTLFGESVYITITNEGVFINGALVTVADIEAQNGLVHVIDAVITPPATNVILSDHPELGHILTDSNGFTLYFLSRDAKDVSNCTGTCLNNWPVFYAANLRLGEGLDISDFESIDRGDGAMQTTYKGWPLYYYVADKEPGDAIGDGRSNVWFAAKPDYTIMIVNNQLTGNDGKNYKGDYTEGDEIIQYFTDGFGRTLYTWSRDSYNTNKFTSEDFANNAVWPVYEEESVVIPSTLDATLFSVIEVHGRNQMTYKGWPLYYFGADGEVRGSNKGVSVPTPGIWPVARQNMDAAKYTTVVDIATSNDDFSILVAALTREDLTIDFVGALTGEGPFTVFAPTNAAFTALLAELGASSLDDIDTATLEAVLQMHVLAGKVMSTDLSEGLTAETLLGQELTFSLEGGAIVTDPNARVSNITAVDIEAQNGVVHVIDKVILVDLRPATVVDIATSNDDFSILVAALTREDLTIDFVSALTGEGPFTVFAPTNAAFTALLAELGASSLDDIDTATLEAVLQMHVLAGKVMSTDLSEGLTAETLLGQELRFSLEGGATVTDPNGRVSNITAVDIEAQNGVVHVIDKVILVDLRPATVVDIATSNDDFSILVAALTREDLTIDFVGALTGEGPFTVFAPTNAAFAALLAELGATSLDDIDTATLEAVLQMHVLAGKVMSTDLSEGLTAETLLGQELTFSLEGGATVTDPNGRVSNITAVDIEAQNGVVHVIDKVILVDLTATSVASLENMRFDFYPNPASGYIIVRTDEIGSSLRIIDISGKLMHAEQIRNSSQRVDLNGVKAGVYFISIEGEGKRVTQKLIVR